MGKYTWEYGDKVFYTASAIGNCTRALYLDRQGITHEPTPQWLLDKFQEGVDNEQPILDMFSTQKVAWKIYTPDELEAQGWEMGEYLPDRDVDYSKQVRVRAPVGQYVITQAHLDAIAYRWLAGDDRQGEQRIIEAKAFGPSYWEKYLRQGLSGFPLYAWQLTIQMKGAGLPALFIVGRKDDNGVVQEIKVEQVDELPVKWAQVMGKVFRVEKMLADNQMPDCEKPLQYPCPFYTLHDEEPGIEVGDTKMFLLESLAMEYDRHGKIAKEHNAKKKDIAKEIAVFFDEEVKPRATDETAAKTVLTDNLRISDVSFYQEGDIDGIKLAADGIDPAKYRKPGYTVRYPKVTKRTGAKEDTDADPFHGIPTE